jgi:hypothetical protein
MKCQKVRRLLPLLAGAELPESKIPPVRTHLEGCTRCREEYEKYTFLVSQTREWLAEDKADWEEQEWQQIIRSVVDKGSKKKTFLALWPFPKVWAYALMAGAVLLLTALVIRPPFVEQIGLTSRYADVAGLEKPGGFEETGKQEVISMTMVSKETGLKIVWVFNKNFNLEEN